MRPAIFSVNQMEQIRIAREIGVANEMGSSFISMGLNSEGVQKAYRGHSNFYAPLGARMMGANNPSDFFAANEAVSASLPPNWVYNTRGLALSVAPVMLYLDIQTLLTRYNRLAGQGGSRVNELDTLVRVNHRHWLRGVLDEIKNGRPVLQETVQFIFDRIVPLCYTTVARWQNQNKLRGLINHRVYIEARDIIRSSYNDCERLTA